MLFVLWHKSPDTDAILSAIVYAKFSQACGKDATPIRLGELNNETKFVLQYLGWDTPELHTTLPAGSEIVLTDHNELSQTIDNFHELTLKGIIDHHKCTITTSEPTEIIIVPIASTCSVIYWLWKSMGIEIPKDVATAMIMGIISDTLYFRSPTTTAYDKQIAQELNAIAGIENLEQLSLDMFNAKSDLGDIAVRNLVTMDYKIFETNGKKFGAGTIETTNPSYTLNRKEEIVTDLIALKAEQGLDMIMLSVVDILNEHNVTIVPTDADATVIKSVFDADTIDNLADLGGRISRKKQIAGPLTDYFTAL